MMQFLLLLASLRRPWVEILFEWFRETFQWPQFSSRVCLPGLGLMDPCYDIWHQAFKYLLGRASFGPTFARRMHTVSSGRLPSELIRINSQCYQHRKCGLGVFRDGIWCIDPCWPDSGRERRGSAQDLPMLRLFLKRFLDFLMNPAL